MFAQLVLVAVVREDERLSVRVAPEHHVGVQQSAQLAEERRGAVAKLFWWDVDH